LVQIEIAQPDKSTVRRTAARDLRRSTKDNIMGEIFNKLKSQLISTLITCFIVAFIFKSCFGKTDEYGILGMDKDGRQIMLQTLNASSSTGVQYTSEWDDTIFIQRLWQEPMRTTFRVVMTATPEQEAMAVTSMALGNLEPYRYTDKYLDSSFETFLSDYGPSVVLQSDLEMTRDEFRQQCRDSGINTVRDLLGGLGFRQYQYYINNSMLFYFDLPATNRTFHGG